MERSIFLPYVEEKKRKAERSLPLCVCCTLTRSTTVYCVVGVLPVRPNTRFFSSFLSSSLSSFLFSFFSSFLFSFLSSFLSLSLSFFRRRVSRRSRSQT